MGIRDDDAVAAARFGTHAYDVKLSATWRGAR